MCMWGSLGPGWVTGGGESECPCIEGHSIQGRVQFAPKLPGWAPTILNWIQHVGKSLSYVCLFTFLKCTGPIYLKCLIFEVFGVFRMLVLFLVLEVWWAEICQRTLTLTLWEIGFVIQYFLKVWGSIRDAKWWVTAQLLQSHTQRKTKQYCQIKP